MARPSCFQGMHLKYCVHTCIHRQVLFQIYWRYSLSFILVIGRQLSEWAISGGRGAIQNRRNTAKRYHMPQHFSFFVFRRIISRDTLSFSLPRLSRSGKRYGALGCPTFCSVFGISMRHLFFRCDFGR